MALTALYKKYFQKSKIFLYPLLDIQRGSYAVPTETYICWNSYYNSEDMRLVCVYNVDNNLKYEEFEKKVLFKHSRLVDYTKINDTTSVFTFDFSDYSEDWFNFMNGKYSKINPILKRKILNYFNDNSANYVYVNSYLYPEKFFTQYATILDVDVEFLKEVGELCSKPDLNKETLVLEPANLQKLNINLNL